MLQQKTLEKEPDATMLHSCQEGSPAKIQVVQDCKPVCTESGPALSMNNCDYSMISSQIMQFLKTSPDSAETDLQRCSQKLPRSGMMRNGILYELPDLEHPIKENVSLLWPTPSGTSNHHQNHVVGRLDEWGGIIKPIPWNTTCESALCKFRGMDDGTTYGVDRIDTIRNSVVPYQIYPILKAIVEIECNGGADSALKE